MKKLILLLFFLGVILCIYIYTQTRPPKNNTYPQTVVHDPGESTASFIDELAEKKIIKNKELFRIFLILLGYDRSLKNGMYQFTEPQTLFDAAYKLYLDSSNVKGVKVVIPEGSTVLEIQDIVMRSFSIGDNSPPSKYNFSSEDEGYLFPDTYFFSKQSTQTHITATLKDNFDAKTNELFRDKTPSEIHDIIVMASLLEKEGRTLEERKVISGILWKRIRIGMPLQVDATFLYTHNKGSSELTISDLKVDNPYNTYTRKGLPIGPINNPGIETITAAMNPVDSPYLFYLHDAQGKIHYAKDFQQHKKNKALYLK
jgi:UPF0755 protein